MRPLVLAGAVAWALVTLAAPVLADDDTKDLEGLLEEPVVSSASKTPELESAAPATSTTLTAEDLRRYGIKTLDEAINFLSLGMVTEDQIGVVEIGARGVLITQDYGSHVLLMIDGHVMNEQWGGTAYFERGAGIPLELVDHIEVILGPGSVLYGSNAMLGVIHVVTKRARDYQGIHVIAESEVPTSIRVGVGLGEELRIFGERGEMTFQVEHYSRSGPAFDFGPQDYGEDSVTGLPRRWSNQTPPGVWGGTASESSYTEAPAAYGRLRVGNADLKVRSSFFKRAIPYGGGNFDDPDNYELDRWLSADLSHRAILTPSLELVTRLYGDLYDYQQFYPSNAAEDCLEEQPNGCLYYLLGVARWAGVEPQLSYDWTKDRRFVSLLGVDARLKSVESRIDIIDRVTGERPPSFGVYDELEKSLAAYLQQTAAPTTWLGLNAGARIDVDDRFGAYVSPRAAAAVKPWDGGTVKAVYSQAFREPTAFEIYYADPTSQIAAPDLRPETVRSVEGSIEHRFGTQKILVGGFRAWFTDLVLTQPLSAEEIDAAISRGELDPTIDYAEQSRNVAGIDTYGFNVGYEGSLVSGRLRYAATVTGAKARRDVPGSEPLELGAAAQIFGNARISYDFSNGWPTVGVAGRWTGTRPANNFDSTSAIPIPYAPPMGEVRGTISGPFPLRGLSYRVVGNYAFTDRHPYIVGPATLRDGTAELAPVDRFRVTVGFQYDLVL